MLRTFCTKVAGSTQGSSRLGERGRIPSNYARDSTPSGPCARWYPAAPMKTPTTGLRITEALARGRLVRIVGALRAGDCTHGIPLAAFRRGRRTAGRPRIARAALLRESLQAWFSLRSHSHCAGRVSRSACPHCSRWCASSPSSESPRQSARCGRAPSARRRRRTRRAVSSSSICSRAACSPQSWPEPPC